MRKMTLMLFVASTMTYSLGQATKSKGAVESGNSMVSEPKSDFCIKSFAEDTTSKGITEPIEGTQKGDAEKDEVDLAQSDETAVQENKNYASEVVVESALKAAEVSVGKVTHYGWKDNFHGKKMSNGEIFNRNELTSAVPMKGGKPKYPFGTKLRVTNVTNGKTVVVKVTDTGSFGSKGILLDLSYGAFKSIADPEKGLVTVKIEKL